MVLTEEMLARAGWEKIGGRMTLKTNVKGDFYGLKIRLTWDSRTKELTINYGSWPIKVEYVNQLVEIMDAMDAPRIC